MNDDTFAFCSHTDKLHNQLNQKLLSWSNHIQSWVDNSGLPLHIIRYEDMKEKTFDTFKAAVEFIGLQYSDHAIEQAIHFSDFNVVKQQEEKFGFKEKSQNSEQFFRKGIIGSWKNELNQQEVEMIMKQHQTMMTRFGYI